MLTKKIIFRTFFLFYIGVNILASPYSKKMNDLIDSYYRNNDTNIKYDSEMSNVILNTVDKTEKQTYKNIIIVLKMHINAFGSSRQTYSALKETLKENTPLLSEDNANYLTSVADLMSALIKHSSFNELLKFSREAVNLYEKALKIEPDNFNALLGSGIANGYRPKFAGGGIDKALPILINAEKNAKEKWQKYISYIWLSQAYMKINDKANYKKYIDLATGIYPDSGFLQSVKKLNDGKKISMFDNSGALQ